MAAWANPYVPYEAELVERLQESDTIFTLRLRFTDPEVHRTYSFLPGQFNMLYLFGVGEAAISIVSHPENGHLLDHTVRAVGRVTKGLAQLKPGDRIGIRGPYGRGWPMKEAEGKDVIVVTGGLGCAPTVSVVDHIVERRQRYGSLHIIQGVKHPKELIYRPRYDAWARVPDTQVLLAADECDEGPRTCHVGLVTDLFEQVPFDPENVVTMMCGPEGMMRAAARLLNERGMPEGAIYLSMERNMQCAIGLCGHCQFGGKFICKNGPVFAYPEVKDLLTLRGF
jgi:sulfhydrogenase subunit gamma (sulfur reductase)